MRPAMEAEQPPEPAQVEDSSTDSLKSLGYMSGMDQLDLPYAVFKDFDSHSSELLTEASSLISVLPPRPYTGKQR